jgi:hypothetical protein
LFNPRDKLKSESTNYHNNPRLRIAWGDDEVEEECELDGRVKGAVDYDLGDREEFWLTRLSGTNSILYTFVCK